MDIKKDIMRFFANQFETRTRDNGETFYCLGDSRPDWCQDIARECHGDLMPDDYRYYWLSSGADSLADIDSDNWDDSVHEIADGLIEVYNGRLISWLSSNLNRAEYVNDAVNSGLVDLSGNFDLFRTIMVGQFEEIGETLNCLISEISDLAENAEPYAAGFNMCGYMPDSEPVTFSDFDDAKGYIAEEIERREIEEREQGNWGLAEEYEKAREYVESQESEFSVTVNHNAFWVSVSEDWLQGLGE